jgi:hypothetical protein
MDVCRQCLGLKLPHPCPVLQHLDFSEEELLPTLGLCAGDQGIFQLLLSLGVVLALAYYPG